MLKQFGCWWECAVTPLVKEAIYGGNGPLKEQSSYDVIAQALSGLMSMNGEPGRMPTPCGLAIGDISFGLFSVFGMVSALFARERTGVGQRVETSILDVLLAFQSYRVPQVFGAGISYPLRRPFS